MSFPLPSMAPGDFEWRPISFGLWSKVSITDNEGAWSPGGEHVCGKSFLGLLASSNLGIILIWGLWGAASTWFLLLPTLRCPTSKAKSITYPQPLPGHCDVRYGAISKKKCFFPLPWQANRGLGGKAIQGENKIISALHMSCQKSCALGQGNASCHLCPISISCFLCNAIQNCPLGISWQTPHSLNTKCILHPNISNYLQDC